MGIGNVFALVPPIYRYNGRPASSAPAPGEEDVPGEGRRLAIRKAHEAVPYISRLIRDASAKMIAEEESIKAELQNRWLSFENAKRRSERGWY